MKMMLNAKVIGVGAAGNKGAIQLIEDGVVEPTDVLLLNSTLKDIPVQYRHLAIEFAGAIKGCGKERHLANKMAYENLQNGDINLDGLMAPEDKMVIICNSSEGGTGCGASTILGQYFDQVLQAKVHMFVFGGFQEDARGLKNTVEYFKDLSPNYVVQAISNKKFLDECNGNKIKAEKAANAEFSKRISILLGKDIVDSEQNMDETDFYKLTTNPGFMTIEHGSLGKIKNVEEYNKIINRIIDNSKSFDFEATCTKFGVILNIHDKTKDAIDYLHGVIKQKLGTAFDTFLHVQDVGEEEYISIIASGMKLPTDDIQSIYDEFIEQASKVDKSPDKFFDMQFDTSSHDFDMGVGKTSASKIQENKNNFFNRNTTQVKGGKFQNIKVSDEV